MPTKPTTRRGWPQASIRVCLASSNSRCAAAALLWPTVDLTICEGRCERIDDLLAIPRPERGFRSVGGAGEDFVVVAAGTTQPRWAPARAGSWGWRGLCFRLRRNCGAAHPLRAFAFGLDRSTGVAFLTDDNSGGDNGGCGAESGDGGEGDPVAGARTSGGSSPVGSHR